MLLYTARTVAGNSSPRRPDAIEVWESGSVPWTSYGVRSRRITWVRVRIAVAASFMGLIANVTAGNDNSNPDAVLALLRRIHGPSWLAGGIVAVSILACGHPHVLVSHVHPEFFNVTDLLSALELFALIASTVYVVECPIRRSIPRRQFSLKDLFLAVTAICLAAAATADQYASWQACLRFLEEHPDFPGDFLSPPLVEGPWLFRLPLLFGLACLAYVIVEGACWAVRKAIWFMTLNWNRDDGCSGQ
jgi:hypothetical protein